MREAEEAHSGCRCWESTDVMRRKHITRAVQSIRNKTPNHGKLASSVTLLAENSDQSKLLMPEEILLLGSHGPLSAGCIHQSSFSRHLFSGQQVLHVYQILRTALLQTFDNIFFFPLELPTHLKLLFPLPYAFKAFIPSPPQSPIPPFFFSLFELD